MAHHPAVSSPRARLTLALRVHYVLATWFGCGYSPIAPGTAGSLGVLPLCWALSHVGSVAVNCGVIVVASVWGAYSAHRVALHRDDEDPGLVVIDEVAGVLIALTFTMFCAWPFQVLAWVLFRVLDITKPGPIGTLEHTKPIGLGIMLDDLLAGVVAGAVAWAVAGAWAAANA